MNWTRVSINGGRPVLIHGGYAVAPWSKTTSVPEIAQQTRKQVVRLTWSSARCAKQKSGLSSSKSSSLSTQRSSTRRTESHGDAADHWSQASSAKSRNGIPKVRLRPSPPASSGVGVVLWRRSNRDPRCPIDGEVKIRVCHNKLVSHHQTGLFSSLPEALHTHFPPASFVELLQSDNVCNGILTIKCFTEK